MYKCKTCGSENVEQLGWVNLNTGIPNGSPNDLDDEDANYCNTCTEHCKIVIEDEKT